MATEYYNQMLKEGTEYQEKIAKLFGFVNYNTMQEQFKVGENALGIEIKYDKNMAKTGNLYFEVAEKTDARNSYYSWSGILREDNAWLYLIGNDEIAYIFAKKDMVAIVEGNRLVESKTKTSLGFLIPKADAERLKIAKIDLSLGVTVMDVQEQTKKIKSRVLQYMGNRGIE